MTTNALTRTSTVDSLIGAYRAHVLGRPLPAPVELRFIPSQKEIIVQPEGGLDFVRKLGNILLWAYTLTDVTAEWWHTPNDRLHITVDGRTNTGTRFSVYGGCEFTQCHGLIRLDPDQKEGVSIDELYTLANLLREAQHEREAA